MTGPIPDPLRAVLRDMSHQLSVSALATLDALVPAEEHVAISLALRDWIAFHASVDGYFARGHQSERLRDDPMFIRASTAYAALKAQMNRANDAIAARVTQAP